MESIFTFLDEVTKFKPTLIKDPLVRCGELIVPVTSYQHSGSAGFLEVEDTKVRTPSSSSRC